MINIVGLGYGEIDDLTIKTYKILKESKNIYIKNTVVLIICSLKRETMDKITFWHRNIHIFYVEWGKSIINKLYIFDYFLYIKRASENPEDLHE